MKRMKAQEKILEYEQLRQLEHGKIDILTRDQLKRFLKRNGMERQQPQGEENGKD